MQPEDSVPGWSTPPLPAQSSAWRPPQPPPSLDLRPAPSGLPPVPPPLVPARPRGRTRIAVLVGAVAAVLVIAVGGVTAAFALRTDDAKPSAAPSEAAALTGGQHSNAQAPAAASPSSVPPSPSEQGEGATSTSGAPSPSSKPTTPPPAAPAPATQAPATQAPATRAPATQAPVTKAPVTKAPATKAPTTKAPAKKAPEINKATAKSGTRGAGPCSAKLAAGYGCFATYGDIWWVYDTKADGHSAVVFWEVGDRSGQCANSMGNGTIGACNKNYPENQSGRAKVCIMDWDTKQVHQCTGYFTFKTS